MRKFKEILIYVFLIVIFIGAARNLFGSGYFNMHDDLQVMRLYEMEKCFADGQIPCRWAPDMAWGYGQAMFNYYSALPYYLGYLIRVFSPLSIMSTVLTLFNISLVASGIGMYLLAKRFWGRLGGMVSSVLYVYAPYHLLDIYIRGAMSEAFSLAILPFLWLAIYSYIQNPRFKNFSFVSLTLGLLLITHNVSTLMYAPFTAVWAIFWLVRKRDLKTFVGFAGSLLLGVGLSAFFFLPVAFERNLIQTQFLTMDYLNYEAHFVTLYQLFIQRIWGHGPSIFGPYDDISFQIGWPHWFLIVPLVLLVFASFMRKKELTRSGVLLGLVGLFLFSAFLTHPKSIFIWKAIPTMAIIQFPWRFLGPSIFFLSFAAGGIFLYKFRMRKVLFALVILLAVVLNFNYAVPWNRSYNYSDAEKLSGVAFDLQRQSAILDYLPVTAKIAPKEAAFTTPKIIEGQGEATNYITTSSTFSFDLEVFSDEAKIQIPIEYFPNWTVVSGGNIIPHTVEGDYGLLTIRMPQGKHIIQGRFEDTPVRTVGNLITLLSILILSGGYFYTSDNKYEKGYKKI